MAYYVQEMTVRLGAVTKRGHAEAIFDGFGPVLGLVLDLRPGPDQLADARDRVHRHDAGDARLFGIPEWITFLGVTLLLMAIVISGKYWTFEKHHAVLLPLQPGLHPGRDLGDEDRQRARRLGRWSAAGSTRRTSGSGGARSRGADHAAHGQHRHDHHAVADLLPAVGRGGQGHGHPRHQVRQDRHLVRLVPDLHRGGLHHHRHGGGVLLPSGRPDRRRGRGADRAKMPEVVPAAAAGALGQAGCSPSACSTPACSARCASRSSTCWAVGEVFGWAHSLNKSVREAPWFYVVYLLHAAHGGRWSSLIAEHATCRTRSPSSCRWWP